MPRAARLKAGGREGGPPPREIKPNWKNQTIWTGDNLDIMRGMNSATVDLIYLDPPFNSSHNYAAPIGSKAAGAAFKDTWGLDDINLAWHGEIKHEQPGLYSLLAATREIHGDSMMSYLIYMAIRVMEMKRLLKPTGSIYLHCDQTASHYLKLLMDSVFGKAAFRNEVVWHYEKWTNAANCHQRNHDAILFYAYRPATFNKLYGDLTVRQKQLLEAGYNTGSSSGKRIVRVYDDENANVTRKMPDWVAEGRAVYRVARPKGKAMADVWQLSALNGQSKERVGYPTQKPLALLYRIIDASSNPGDMVLDPFCGCATALVAAEQRQREWAGIDISPKAVDLVRERLDHGEVGALAAHHVVARTDVPRRTDLGRVIQYNDARNKRHLYGEQGGYCNGCEAHFELRHFHVDHIVPRAKGGTDHISNLQLLCGACNTLKGTKTQEELIVMLTDKGWIKRKKAA